MRDLVLFLQMCASSGTLVGSLCGLFIVPIAAWLGIRIFSPMVKSMHGDPDWQAPLASIGGTLPGFIFLTLGAIGLLGAASSGCLSFTWGRILFVAILFFLCASLARATLRVAKRLREIRALVASSQHADKRLRAIADAVRMRARIIESPLPFCALSGGLCPTVLISTESLLRLDDVQLEAALRHEQAHAARGDVFLASILSFFADLLPLPVCDLMFTYHTARELAADRYAARRSAPEHLAGAIIALVRIRHAGPALPALADDLGSIRSRIAALFDTQAPPRYRLRLIAVAALATILFASFAPAAIVAANFYRCAMQGMQM